MSKTETLRKLDAKEVALIERGWGQHMFLRVRVKSRIDLLGDKHNLTILKRSILAWKRSQKLLSSRIAKLDDNNEYYFINHIGEEALDNVKLLRLSTSSNSPNAYKAITELLIDYALNNSMCPEREPERILWDLYVFECDPIEHVYEFITIFHHAISQGKTGFINLCTLLRIVEAVHKNENESISLEWLREGELFPGCYSLFRDSTSCQVETPLVKVPSFIDSKRAKANSLSRKPSEYVDSNAKLVYADSGRPFENSIADLIEVSRLNIIKYKVMNLDEDLFSRLLSRCKKEGTKLTSLVELVLCVAVKELYEKLGVSTMKDSIDNIVYFTVISTRGQARPKPIGEEVMGLCTGGLITCAAMADVDVLIENRNDIEHFVWPIAKKWSERLHERLRTDKSRIFPKAKPLSPGELTYHFILSNIGDLGATTSVGDYFNVADVECVTTFDKNATMRLFVNYLLTQHNGKQLKWTIMYHAHFVDDCIIENLLDLIIHLLNDIVKS